MKTKKIFFLADANSIHTAKWIDYFVSKNYDVHLATFAKYNKTKCQKIYFLGDQQPDVKGGNYRYLLYISKLAQILKNVQPDYINAHYSYSMGLVALLANKFSKVKSAFSVVCHGSDILDTPLPLVFDKINKFVLNRADKIFAVSDQITDKVKSFGVDENKIFTGQYGIDIANSEVEKTIDILSNRAYNENSRIDFLLEAIDQMDKKNLKIVFVLPTASEEDIEKLKNKYPYIIFHKSVEYDKMQELLSQSKIYISATKSDGTSLSLLEAMMMGCIPVISNIVSNRSWVLDGVNGYLFNSKHDFQNKLRKSLENQNSQKMIEANMDIILDKADYKKQMSKIENFLLENV